ncbi:MAG TPA: hypothetical protein VJA16_07460 [Thermoanaerobaculia bacterium]
MNAATWLAAMSSGQTRQLKPAWLLFLAFVVALDLASTFSWGHDLDIPGGAALIILGLPTSAIPGLVVGMLPRVPTGNLVNVAGGMVIGLVIPYVQTFILLPLLFRKRADAPGSND